MKLLPQLPANRLITVVPEQPILVSFVGLKVDPYDHREDENNLVAKYSSVWFITKSNV